MRLSHRDYDALLRTILDMHDRAATGSLLTDAPQVISKLIPCDYFAILDAKVTPSPVTLHLTGVWETSPRITQDISRRMAHYFPTHPFTSASQKQRNPSGLLFSDFYSDRQLRDQAFYWDLYRRVEIGKCVAIGSATGDGMSFVSANRRAHERDFTERDRLLMTLLLPHFEQARRTSELAGALRERAGERMRAYGLTPRETDVANWLSQGKTNPEIAAILHIRSRTVEKHVERILSKLEVETRTAAALRLLGVER